MEMSHPRCAVLNNNHAMLNLDEEKVDSICSTNLRHEDTLALAEGVRLQLMIQCKQIMDFHAYKTNSSSNFKGLKTLISTLHKLLVELVSLPKRISK